MTEIIINKERHECPPAVVAYIKELKKENARLEEGYQKSVGVIAATDCVKCKKDAEPVKHGHWIKTPSPYHFKCSSCGVTANIKFHSVEDHKFCWHCGAEMDGESDE